MTQENNVQRLAEALGFDPAKLPAEKIEQIKGLSEAEVDQLINLGGKVGHKDDEYGPFPV